MPSVVSAPGATGAKPGAPRLRGAGAVLLVCGAVLAVSAPMLGTPASAWCVSVTAVSGLVLVAQLPHVRSIALAAALGAATLLAGAAPGSDYPAFATVAAGAALAVIGVSAWRLWWRREWAPWHGARGVLAASAAALALLAVGVVLLQHSSVLGGTGGEPGDVVRAALGTVVPWSFSVAAAGWLRRPVAAALLIPAAVQLAVVVGT